jgi:hypothetical protein
VTRLWDSSLRVRANILLCMNPHSQRSFILRPMSRDEALAALEIREQEFHQLRDKMLSFRTIAPSAALVLPVVAAIVECQWHIYQLEEFLDYRAKTNTWLM